MNANTNVNVIVLGINLLPMNSTIFQCCTNSGGRSQNQTKIFTVEAYCADELQWKYSTGWVNMNKLKASKYNGRVSRESNVSIDNKSTKCSNICLYAITWWNLLEFSMESEHQNTGSRSNTLHTFHMHVASNGKERGNNSIRWFIDWLCISPFACGWILS